MDGVGAAFEFGIVCLTIGATIASTNQRFGSGVCEHPWPAVALFFKPPSKPIFCIKFWAETFVEFFVHFIVERA